MFKTKSFRAAFAVLCLAGLTAVSAIALPCLISSGKCAGSVDVSIYTGPPPIPVCQIGDDIVELSFTSSCKGTSFSDSELLCSSSSSPVTFYDSATGITHAFKLRKGKTWGDAAANCSFVGYSTW